MLETESYIKTTWKYQYLQYPPTQTGDLASGLQFPTSSNFVLEWTAFQNCVYE